MPDPQFTVDTGVTMNNRTLNFSSAAEPENDAFFDMMLSEKYGRRFPATSSVQTWIRFGMPNGGRVYLDWTPFHWCVNGTVSGCANVLGDDGGTGKSHGPTLYRREDDQPSAAGGMPAPTTHIEVKMRPKYLLIWDVEAFASGSSVGAWE
ncbi:hypothetical protein B0A50_06517 [Salinomyces thailandicus]|uniref:Uncharacterized protein n=1 Tax=Salinomyces thailandicus TaxID=706561 RepID=A0A4U0TNS2_9PEZI|nr:hypothetical protein B0A50_06517 [Salinomyces thailandica]